MGEERLVARFARLCEIPSITGDERAVADAVAAELTELGIEFHEDDSAEEARAGAGNLIARIPGREGAAGWAAFFAHLDTVPHEEPIRVVDDEGVLRSAGDTILGADNKAAVTVLMELGAQLAEDPGPVGVELVFTVAEEQGLRGAAALDPSGLKSEIGFVFDHATPIGEVITAAPTYKKIMAEFRGVEAHAGIRPEAGRSAIEAATHAVATMELGRLDDETTANVGVIDGGTAPNVVAGVCRLQAEARSVDTGRAEEVAQRMIDACAWAAGEAGVDVDLLMETYLGFSIPEDAAAVRVVEEACATIGVPSRCYSTGGGSDANALRSAGFDALLLANGTEANHTPDESVAISELVRMLEVCSAIVVEAGREDGAEAC